MVTMLLLSVLACGSSGTAGAGGRGSAMESRAVVDEPAPGFTLQDLDGNTASLADHQGRPVVIEWFNPDCPYIRDPHAPGGALHTLGNDMMKKGVVWLAINSNAPGTQGDDPDRNRQAKAEWALDYPILMDPEGVVGRRYGAAATPHMFVIDAEGVLRYHGAVDNAPMREVAGDRKAYAEDAIEAVLAGKEPKVPRTRPYGCSVKYR